MSVIQTTFDLGEVVRAAVKVSSIQNKDLYLGHMHPEGPEKYLVTLPNGNLSIERKGDMVHFTAEYLRWEKTSFPTDKITFSVSVESETILRMTIGKLLEANDQVYHARKNYEKTIDALKSGNIDSLFS